MNRAFLSIGARVLVLLALSGMSCLADSWRLPAREKYCSRNRQFCFEVTPKKLESQLKFFEDKSQGKENAGSPAGLKDNFCKGSLYKVGESKTRHVLWSKRLVNEVAPVSALVSDSGDYVVTFDNWHSVGYGPDVVVIYGPGGKLITQRGLTDFLNRDELIRLDRSVSSIWWAGDEPQHYIEESAHVLVLIVVLGLKVNDEIFFHPGSKSETRKIRIVLSTGEILIGTKK